jgi:short-subunit dehydrogenase
MTELKCRTAVVTGASRGIGVHIARLLARHGVKLALVARSEDTLRALAAELSQAGAQAVAIPADLSDLNGLDSVLDRAQTELGPIDLLVNNAGIEGVRSYLSESDADTETMLRLNLLSPMLLTRKAVSRMVPRKTGHVVNIGSLAGKNSTPYCVSYAAAKAGLIAFTHCVRAELLGSGVSASVITPGFVSEEGMFAEKAAPRGIRVSPMLGTSRPEQVAQAVLAAYRDDRAEIVVNPGPILLMQAINQIAPSAIAWLQNRIGVNGMLRTMALGDDTVRERVVPR